MKLPSELYVGLKGATPKDGDLAFMTPKDNTKAFEKRKHTVDSWCGKNATSKTFKNELLEGFKIEQTVSRWSTSNKVWRVYDPRGYQLEISSGNLQNIINDCKLDKGAIAGKCIWARDGAHNILLHEDSEEYKEAIKSTERLETRIPLKEVGISDIVETVNGVVGEYFGNQKYIGDVDTYKEFGYGSPEVAETLEDYNKVQSGYVLKITMDDGNHYYAFYKTLKVSKIIKKQDVPGLRDLMSDLINSDVENGISMVKSDNLNKENYNSSETMEWYLKNSGYSRINRKFFMFNFKLEDIKMNFSEILFDELDEFVKSAGAVDYPIFCEERTRTQTQGIQTHMYAIRRQHRNAVDPNKKYANHDVEVVPLQDSMTSYNELKSKKLFGQSKINKSFYSSNRYEPLVKKKKLDDSMRYFTIEVEHEGIKYPLY